MSEDDKNKPPTDDKKPLVTKIEIDRSAEVEAIRKEKEAAEAKALEATQALEAEKKRSEDAKKITDDEKKVIEDAKTAAEDELKEKKSILAQQALEAYEKEKTQILDLIKDSKLTDEQKGEVEEKLKDPKNLETVKSLITMMAAAIKPPEKKGDDDKGGDDKGGEKKPLAGKAPPFVPPTDAETFETKVEMVDEYYKRAYYKPQLYTKEQVDEAKAKIDELFRSLIGGKSWKQLRSGMKLPLPQMMSCPKCNKTFVGELPPRCPQCAFNLSRTGDYQKLT